MIYGFCLKHLRSRADSQDAVMSVYEKISKELLSKEVKHFKSWLYVVSKNYCLMKHRRKKNRVLPGTFVENAGVTHLDHDEDIIESQLEALDECIKQLKSDQQRCIRLFFLEKKSYREVNEMTGLTIKKVKSHIQNGKKNLKACLESKRIHV